MKTSLVRSSQSLAKSTGTGTTQQKSIGENLTMLKPILELMQNYRGIAVKENTDLRLRLQNREIEIRSLQSNASELQLLLLEEKQKVKYLESELLLMKQNEKPTLAQNEKPNLAHNNLSELSILKTSADTPLKSEALTPVTHPAKPAILQTQKLAENSKMQIENEMKNLTQWIDTCQKQEKDLKVLESLILKERESHSEALTVYHHDKIARDKENDFFLQNQKAMQYSYIKKAEDLEAHLWQAIESALYIRFQCLTILAESEKKKQPMKTHRFDNFASRTDNSRFFDHSKSKVGNAARLNRVASEPQLKEYSKNVTTSNSLFSQILEQNNFLKECSSLRRGITHLRQFLTSHVHKISHVQDQNQSKIIQNQLNQFQFELEAFQVMLEACISLLLFPNSPGKILELSQDILS